MPRGRSLHRWNVHGADGSADALPNPAAHEGPNREPLALSNVPAFCGSVAAAHDGPNREPLALSYAAAHGQPDAVPRARKPLPGGRAVQGPRRLRLGPVLRGRRDVQAGVQGGGAVPHDEGVHERR